MTPEEIREIIRDTILELKSADDCYPEHHKKFVDMLIKRDERRQERWKKFTLSFIGGTALVIVGWLIWAGTVVLEHLGVHVR